MDGLRRQLTPPELGRALYHLAKRRHFKGRELEATDSIDEESTEDKEARSEREKLSQALKSSGATLGGYLALLPAGQRKRGVHALRDHVHDEFDRLVTYQKGFHPALAVPDFLLALRQAVFAQKPVFWRKSTLGSCRFIPGAPLAPKASWISIQRRMLEKLNNLAIAGGNGRSLEPSERAAILAQLQAQGSMSWGGVRKTLEPIFKARGESARHIRFNLEEGGEKALPGNPLEMKLAQIFGAAWADHPQKEMIREAVDTRLRAADYGEIGDRVIILQEGERRARRRKAAQTFGQDFGATTDQIADLEKLTFPTGWDAYSYDAIRAVIPKLEEGVRFGSLIASPEFKSWRDETFPHREQATGEILDRLPSPKDKEEAIRQRNIRNPTVVRVQNELRKVVNNLISVYGNA